MFERPVAFLFVRPAVPPVISSETQMYVAPVDASVMLHCQAEGSPPPSVTWHKDGQPLSESVRQRVLSSGSLQIAFIQPVDTGRYTCTAANAAGTVSLEMSLTVQSTFLIVRPFKPQNATHRVCSPFCCVAIVQELINMSLNCFHLRTVAALC